MPVPPLRSVSGYGPCSPSTPASCTPHVLALRARRRDRAREAALVPLARACPAPAGSRRANWPCVDDQRHVAERRRGVRRAQLDQHAVERLQVLRAAGDAERRVAVREHAGQLHARRQRARHGQVERLAQRRVLRRAELDRDGLVARHRERGAAGRRREVAAGRRAAAVAAWAAVAHGDRGRGRRQRLVAVARRTRAAAARAASTSRPTASRRARARQQPHVAAQRVEHVVVIALQRPAPRPQRVAPRPHEAVRQRPAIAARAARQREHAAGRVRGGAPRAARERRRARQQGQRANAAHARRHASLPAGGHEPEAAHAARARLGHEQRAVGRERQRARDWTSAAAAPAASRRARRGGPRRLPRRQRSSATATRPESSTAIAITLPPARRASSSRAACRPDRATARAPRARRARCPRRAPLRRRGAGTRALERHELAARRHGDADQAVERCPAPRRSRRSSAGNVPRNRTRACGRDPHRPRRARRRGRPRSPPA